ncbi:DUF1707 SHOCT-like domain-containing protein [Streptomyces poonensis]|uniref:Cell wall-active antibiotics response LiaF-like C-terminal domain-containing protein n=1 Tax=Streptomyces poonensis TaxID=68255 RepID=A0A918P9I3_9ACTN|nr:DUF1707 domain-containing protein [Streptomyces poonensis]GGY90494.1 hypothetical protein GCM10010365_06120 [Streptomyces poonensis]GLJ87951.1 hypothetical protein GCM10017589_05510 [Streptomyces poonensis]
MDLQKSAAAQEPLPPAQLRASDADRDRVADLLRDALAEGRLTAEEHAERVEGVLGAKTVGELDVFVRDLPAAHTSHASGATDATGVQDVPVPNRPTPGSMPAEADERVVAVFSAAIRRGRWRAGRRIHAYAIFGSVEIDLSEALFEHRQVMIKAVSVFGSVEIRVPENVSLRGSGGGVLGNFEVDTLDSGQPDAPVVYVDGLAVLGHIEAKPKRGKLIADLFDRVSRKVDDGLRKHLGH